MRVLGIDPGSRITGYGIVEKQGNRLIHIDNGAIQVGTRENFSSRLEGIYAGLQQLIAEYQPEAAAIEQIFVSRNVSSALKLGHARGAAMLAAVHGGLDVHEYTAMQVKSAVVGYGRAAKGQVQQMVKALLNLPEIAQEDASDALAVAICHAHSAGLTQRLNPGKAPRR